MDISIVIPVYNSAESLADLIERLNQVLKNCAEDYEVVLVNDDSSDRSWTVISRLVKTFPFIRAINLMRNYGQHNSLLCGIHEAQYEVIVTMDDDLQHPPEEIPKLLAALDSQCDVVYGVPEEESHVLWRNWASRFAKLIMQVALKVHGVRNVSSFRTFRKPVRDAMVQHHGPYVNIDVLLTWSTKRVRAIRVRHDGRQKGTSQYKFYKLLLHAFNMITGYSAAPLRMASLVGFGFTFFGIAVLIYVVGRYFIYGVAVQGFAFLSSIIAIFAGAQLFALGVIGEYLARMHFRIMDKPPYVVRERLGTFFPEHVQNR